MYQKNAQKLRLASVSPKELKTSQRVDECGRRLGESGRQ